MAIWKKRLSGKPPAGKRAARVFPRTSSIVRKQTPSSSSTEYTCTMLGWLRAAMAFASRSNRPGAFGELGGKDFERDLAVELRVLGEVDLSHAALSELLEDAVVRERPAYHLVTAMATVGAELQRGGMYQYCDWAANGW
jgi:hypothetical protein